MITFLFKIIIVSILSFLIKILVEIGWSILWSDIVFSGKIGHLMILRILIPSLLTYMACGFIAYRLFLSKHLIAYTSIGFFSLMVMLATPAYELKINDIFYSAVFILNYFSPFLGLWLGYILKQAAEMKSHL